MAQYENYKLTYSLGFEKIPEEWNLKKVKYLFNIGRGRVISQEELMDNGLYPVFSSQTQNNGCLGYINTFDFDCEQLTWTTDGANAGTVFIRSGKHNCTNVCGTLQPIKNQAHLKFSHYALQYATQFHKRPDTNGAKIMNNEMAEISFALPSQQEQFKIVEYLNHETAKIDHLIEKQQQLIELLKEKRQAVISHAVTKGLDPNVPMKDSGVEWLGEVPEHWDIVKLSQIAVAFNGDRGANYPSGNDFVDEGIYFISANEVINAKVITETASRITQKKYDELGGLKIKKGDIIYCLRGAGVGKNGICDFDEGTVSSSLMGIRSIKLDPDYLVLLLNSSAELQQRSVLVNGSVSPNLSAENVIGYKFAIPAVDEQIEIKKSIELRVNKIEILLSNAEQAIQLMQERRTALISAAVTGKIDVRNWQAPMVAEADTELSA
jgi:type I restriction enzyme S subunit